MLFMKTHRGLVSLFVEVRALWFVPKFVPVLLSPAEVDWWRASDRPLWWLFPG